MFCHSRTLQGEIHLQGYFCSSTVGDLSALTRLIPKRLCQGKTDLNRDG